MPKGFHPLNSSVSDIEMLNGMVRSLERSEARRVGTTLTQARKMVARRIGITAAAFENYLYRRTKAVPNWLMAMVRAELISVLQQEMQNLEHEINLHRQTGAHHSSDTLASAEAQLCSARAILAGEMK